MKTKSIIYLMMFALFMSMGHILQKMVLNYGVDRFIFGFLRIASGFIIITAIFLLKKYKPLGVIKKNARHFVILGFCFSGCGILLKLWGLMYTTATNAGFIMSLSSLAAVFFAFFLLREKASKGFYIVALVMIFGVYLVATGGEKILPQKGDLIILGVAFLIGFMQIYGKKVLKKLSVIETAFGRSVFGMIFLGFMIPVFAPAGFSTIPNVWVLLLVLANGFTFSGSILFFYKALQQEGASNAGMFAMLIPVLTAILGFFLLGERLSAIQLIGGGIIVVGSFLISRIKVKQTNF
jgi:drug/metabolite transporter (DMT)-like permease